uniref:Uncharacterized protein n=1 Tax=Romanomermis culicivorax TaxID=13658 RepID=A0A915IT62_ROMCU
MPNERRKSSNHAYKWFVHILKPGKNTSGWRVKPNMFDPAEDLHNNRIEKAWNMDNLKANPQYDNNDTTMNDKLIDEKTSPTALCLASTITNVLIYHKRLLAPDQKISIPLKFPKSTPAVVRKTTYSSPQLAPVVGVTIPTKCSTTIQRSFPLEQQDTLGTVITVEGLPGSRQSCPTTL